MAKRTTGVSPTALAQLINDDCANYRYFWACGLIKATLQIWQDPDHRSLLCDDALRILSCYQLDTVPADETTGEEDAPCG